MGISLSLSLSLVKDPQISENKFEVKRTLGTNGTFVTLGGRTDREFTGES